MILYDVKRAPNSLRVRMFLAEKSVSVIIKEVDYGAGEHLKPEFAAVNSWHEVPVLELDSGQRIAESIAICRYIEALYPEPNLFGSSEIEMAMIEMWQRRAELFFLFCAQVFRHRHAYMVDFEKPQIADWADSCELKTMRTLKRFDKHLADHEFLMDRFSIADITFYVGLDFMRPGKMSIPAEFGHVLRYRDTMQARPSSRA